MGVKRIPGTWEEWGAAAGIREGRRVGQGLVRIILLGTQVGWGAVGGVRGAQWSTRRHTHAHDCVHIHRFTHARTHAGTHTRMTAYTYTHSHTHARMQAHTRA